MQGSSGLQSGPLLNGLYLRGYWFDSLGRDDMTQIFDLSLGEETFQKFKDELTVQEDLECFL